MDAPLSLDDDVGPPAPLNHQQGLCRDGEQDMHPDDEDTNASAPLGSQLRLCSDMLAEDASPGDPASGLCAGLSELASLGVSAYDHSQLEKEVMENMDKALEEEEQKRRVDEASRELRAVEEDIRFVKQRLSHIEKAVSLAPKDPSQLTGAAKRELSAIKMERENKLKHLRKIEAKRRALQVCISGSTQEVSSSMQEGSAVEDGDLDEDTLLRLRQVFAPKESEEERLIRTGEMTPFGTRSISIPETTDFDRFLLDSAESHASKKASKTAHRPSPSPAKSSVVVIKNDKTDFQFTDLRAVPAKRRRSKVQREDCSTKKGESPSKKKKKKSDLVRNYKSDSDVSCFEEDPDSKYSDEDVYVPDEDSMDDDDDYSDRPKERKSSGKKKGGGKEVGNADDNFLGRESGETKSRAKKLVDDGDQASYLKRLKAHQMSELKRKHRRILESEDGVVDSDEEDFTEFDEGFKIPNSIWSKLYKYQQTCVRWLWELHQQNCGGIVGDEMGLGKTIQVIAFLAGLSTSNLRTEGDIFRGLGPVVLVCPTTVMHQWVKEFHTWWPPFRVAILHESGSFSGKKASLISVINKHRGVLVTSYAGLVSHQERLLAFDWHYVVLDEGHKIRNPDAQATIAAKRFRTCHRLILSGSPIQNNLKELWSLFDFVFPGKLGTLPVFMQQFSVPIVQGGYANASHVQVQTAYKCATVLRDAIKPYLLRRMKSDVQMNINLPNKSEQVLFCQLTEEQINLYKGYINSKEVGSILDARLQVFVGLINLRKICNHPDLFDGGPKVFRDTDLSQLGEEEKYGFYGRSGKMVVVEALLRLWHSQGHRVLLFTQSRQMMDILELFVKSRGYSYMKMDGTTPISSRQPAITKFNADPSVFVFLLTTRVGGLGVNLTGADRVVLYDPDWNPSTDAQARERAWRIGQLRQVTVYRLLTAGTIEEKIYHRQIFKQFVTNRVLKDPRQRRFFKSNDLFELFSFTELGTQGTETSAIFAGTGSEIRPKRNVKRDPPSKDSVKLAPENISFSEEKREQMKQLAKRLAMSLTKSGPTAKSGTTFEPDSKKSPEAQPGATLESDPKSKNGPDLKSESSCRLISKNGSEENSLANDSEATRPRLNSNKTSERSLVVQRASEQKSLKDKLKNKVSSNGLPEERTHKKSKRRKAARVEGEKIEFVVKKSAYKPPENEEEKSKREDDYVLSKLFKTSGVHTALRHDTIVESSAPDYAIVEGEALRVANEAVRALKESRKQCRGASEGVPTWTGRKPRFGQKKLLPPGSHPTDPQTSTKTKRTMFDGRQDQGGTTSSKDLLAAIRRRKVVFGSEDQEYQPSSLTAKHDELLVDIRNFVAFQASVDGQATTQEILGAFRDKVPGKQTAIFKAMLKKICHYSKNGRGERLWQLKEEFR